MTSSSAPLARARRAALILAGLLHLLSLPALPLLHGWMHAHAHGAGWSAEDYSQGGAPHRHDPGCVLCQGAQEQALPEPSPQPAAGELALLPPAPFHASSPEAAARTRAQARAPPA